jgi:steroid 5-alpha reductase family enzyme
VAPVGIIDALAVAVALGFLGVETVADEQLRAYRKTKPAPGSFLKTGLWAWSRHPNYLGEIGFWWGIGLFGVAAGVPWTLVGAAGITTLFVAISVPLIDARMNRRRPAYAAHCRRIPAIFPLWYGRG